MAQSFSLSKAQMSQMRDKAERMIARAKAISEKSEEAVGQVIQSTEIVGAAFAAGAVKGRFGNVEVMGVPADLGVAVLGHGLAFMGGGKYKEHLHNLADGVLASYMTTLGAGIGSRMARDAAAAAPAGAIPAGGAAAASGHELSAGARISDEELAVLRANGLRR